MDLLIIIIIIMIFASQSGELGEKIKRTFDKKKSSTGGLRPDADYSNVRPEQGEEKAGDSFAEGVSDINKKEKKESGSQNKKKGGARMKESGKKKEKAGSALRVVGIAAAVLIVAACAWDSFYMLNENTYAVVTTFGSPSVVKTAGLHFKIPFIQRVHMITKNIMGMPIGYSVEDDEDPEVSEDYPASVSKESEMITKDFNFVEVDFYIEYQVVDPIQAFIHADTYQEIIKNLAQSYIRDTVGTYNVDDVITTGKSEIQSKVKEKLSNRLEQENIGYGIYNVTIQDAEPPTVEVTNAFKAVEDAKQGMDTAINQAKKYQSEQIPTANAKADKVIQDAEAYKQEKISEATGQAARFNDLYQEYSKYPLITKKRMFYEAMEDVLPELKVIINSSDGTQSLLPLEPFAEIPSGAGVSSQSGASAQTAAPDGQSAQNGGN
ncbi:MAG: FtsH protease activity modulator HflK [Lachnospiraceae bacterium]